MNAMTMISKGFAKSTAVCMTHNIAKVQAGPNQICPQCAVECVNTNNQAHQTQVDREVREKHFSGAMIPSRHKDSGFKNYNVNPELNGQANAKNQSIEFTKNFIHGSRTNLIVVGSTGTGKTHLSIAVARTLLNKGLYVRYITSEELAQRIMNAWDKDTKDKSEESVIYEFAQYDLLILDEYGLHDREKRLELVHKVLYARYDRNRPTMLISNFSLNELITDLGDRLWSRFQQDGLTVVECNWVDQRFQGGTA
ncbi:ATP-binding protein [Acinetobacter gerneri]|jgi:DNA replication protein DnaC|uniref:ATP-binding protein n=1 Tax=Acinetobacter gerneri TaxID=202952 RepID=UPI0023F37E6F|nr:ATP-binding protein [Acinetobacter gerneri]MCH4243725.1 ATP-binding protein [Acinetobacter gerneri]